MLRGRRALRPRRGHRPGTGADPRARGCIEEALRCKETGEEKVILTALCGHGHLDLAAYDAYLAGDVVDHTWEDAEVQEAVAEALTRLPSIPG